MVAGGSSVLTTNAAFMNHWFAPIAMMKLMIQKNAKTAKHNAKIIMSSFSLDAEPTPIQSPLGSCPP